MKYLILISITLAAADFESTIGQNCNLQLNIYTVNTFQMQPWPPYKGSNVEMNMSGVMNQAESVGSLLMFVFYKGSLFYQKSYPEHGNYLAGQTANFNQDFYLMQSMPSGSYFIQYMLSSTTGSLLNCWQVMFTI